MKKKIWIMMIAVILTIFAMSIPAFAAGGSTTGSVEVIPGVPQRNITMHVSDTDGAVSGASLYVTFNTGEKFMGVTNSEGEKTIELIDGAYAYRITKVGYYDALDRFTVSGEDRHVYTALSAIPVSPTQEPSPEPTQAPQPSSKPTEAKPTSDSRPTQTQTPVRTPELTAEQSAQTSVPTSTGAAPGTVMPNVGVKVLYTDGTPVKDHMVELYSTVQQSRTDSDGWVLFTDVEYGNHRIYVKDSTDKVVGSMQFQLQKGDTTNITVNDGAHTFMVNANVQTVSVQLDIDKETGKCALSNPAENGVPAGLAPAAIKNDADAGAPNLQRQGDAAARTERSAGDILMWLWILIGTASAILILLLILLWKRKKDDAEENDAVSWTRHVSQAEGEKQQ